MKKHLFLLSLTLLFLASCEPEKVNKTEPDFKTGLSFNPDDFKSISFATPSASGNLPVSFDLSSDMPPIGNQGRQGSCVSWAVCYGLKGYQERIENKWTSWDDSKKFSPAFMHNQIRVNPNTCDGANFVPALDLLKNQGCCSLGEMPYSDQTCSFQPTAIHKDNAYKYRIKSYLMVNQKKITDIKSFIYEKKPVVIGVEVDKEFMAGTKSQSGQFIWKQNNSSKIGYHAMVAVGFDDNLQAVKVQNSWGTGWGNSGFCWIDYNWFVTATIVAIIAEDEITDNGQTNGPGIEIKVNDLTDTEIGNSTDFTIEVKNTGDEDLSFKDVDLKNDRAAFAFNGMPSTSNIKPGDKRIYNLKFTPLLEDNYSGEFSVKNSNSVSGNTMVTLSAKGVKKATKSITSLPILNTWTDCKSMNQMEVSHWNGSSRTYMMVNANEFRMRVIEINNVTSEITFEFQLCNGLPSPYEDAKVEIIDRYAFKTILATGTFNKNSSTYTLKAKLNNQMPNPVKITALIYADNDLLNPTASQFIEFSW